MTRLSPYALAIINSAVKVYRYMTIKRFGSLFMGLSKNYWIRSMAYSKYKNIKCEANGFKFDSKKEMAYYKALELRAFAGEISNLRLQVKYELTPKLIKDNGKPEQPSSYIADFVYFDNLLDKEIVADVKGSPKNTPEFILKRKQMLNIYSITVKEIR